MRLSGPWTLHSNRPSAEDVGKRLDAAPQPNRVVIAAGEVSAWDSGLLTFLTAVKSAAAVRGIEVDAGAVPEGARKLLALAAAVPEKKGARREGQTEPFLARVGKRAQGWAASVTDATSFVGEVALATGRLFTGRARFRRSDLFLVIQEVGAQALPIVSLISFLVGVILAFVGALQLSLFGAQIFISNLVAIGMAREMGAMMAAIIMAGRTGAAFAAQIGTMQVNEEVDALQTFGIPPMDFLVLPRMLALILMMPLLCLYAIFVGIFGGFFVGVVLLDLSPIQYYHQTLAFLGVADFAVGIGKSVVFGIIIAITGCMCGMRCGRNAAAVGQAATSAVVSAIVLIVVFDGLFAVLTSILGI
ncbi:MAG TPA: ABC transporter permease [Rhodospirillales bacterium]|nr:ABC transporter permease [Rhodospirillales bacterium]